MTSNEYKVLFTPITDDLSKLWPIKDSEHYYTGIYNPMDLVNYIPALKSDYINGNITKREFYDYVNVILKYRTGRHFTDIETIFANHLRRMGWYYIVELQNEELKGVGGGPLYMDFAIMDSNDDYRIVAFAEIDGDPWHKDNPNDKIKNDYFAALGVKLFRFDTFATEALYNTYLPEIEKYVMAPGVHGNCMYMDKKFLSLETV